MDNEGTGMNNEGARNADEVVEVEVAGPNDTIPFERVPDGFAVAADATRTTAVNAQRDAGCWDIVVYSPGSTAATTSGSSTTEVNRSPDQHQRVRRRLSRTAKHIPRWRRRFVPSARSSFRSNANVLALDRGVPALEPSSSSSTANVVVVVVGQPAGPTSTANAAESHVGGSRRRSTSSVASTGRLNRVPKFLKNIRLFRKLPKGRSTRTATTTGQPTPDQEQQLAGTAMMSMPAQVPEPELEVAARDGASPNAHDRKEVAGPSTWPFRCVVLMTWMFFAIVFGHALGKWFLSSGTMSGFSAGTPASFRNVTEAVGMTLTETAKGLEAQPPLVCEDVMDPSPTPIPPAPTSEHGGSLPASFLDVAESAGTTLSETTKNLERQPPLVGEVNVTDPALSTPTPRNVAQFLASIRQEAMPVGGFMGAVLFLLAAMYAVRTAVQFLLNKKAAKGNATVVVESLAGRSPADRQATATEETLSLHSAALSSSPEVVRLLLDRHPEAARVASATVWLPLHYAAKSGNLEKVRMLVEAHPEGVRMRDVEGFLPHHVAAQANDDDTATDVERLSTIFYLLTKYCVATRELAAQP